jgi:hypothetical protein
MLLIFIFFVLKVLNVHEKVKDICMFLQLKLLNMKWYENHHLKTLMQIVV